MQYEVTPTGTRELNTKVIDMGAGLSRLAWITSGEPTSYEVVFGPVIEGMKKRSGISVEKELFLKFAKISGSLNEDEVPDLEKEKERIAGMLGISKKELFETLEPLQALYASADHLKTLLFTITDGMLPSNSGGGYNLRMIMRRVLGFEERYGFDLDYPKIMEAHADYLDYIFPHLKQGVATTIDVIAEEEKRYRATKEKARGIVVNIVKKAKDPKEGVSNKDRVALGSIKTQDLLTLYKSHGIPPESVIEVASENGVEVEMPGNFYDLVREGEGKAAVSSKAPSVKVLFSEVSDLQKTEALYYTREPAFEAEVLGVLRDKYVVLERSAFYPEGGGQVADKGTLDGKKVSYVARQAGVILHQMDEAAAFKKGMKVKGVVDTERRKTIARHHSGAHILNAACREVLGPHIWQAGSYKDEEKAHLDVTHYRRITNDELARIELKANGFIMANLPIKTEVLPRNVAEERYGFTLYQGGAVPGAELRVVSIGDIDTEACGGTHQMLSSTGEIGAFKIMKRESVQDGVERIVYKSGFPAIQYMQEKEHLISEAASVMSVQDEELVRTTRRFFEEWKSQRKKIEGLTETLVREEAKDIIDNYPGKPVMKVLDLDQPSLRKLGLQVAESSNAAACLLNKSGNLVCAAGEASGESAKSMLDRIIKELGGTGGGSDRIAQGKTEKIGRVML
jgi:alanine--tRNA ligase